MLITDSLATSDQELVNILDRITEL